MARTIQSSNDYLTNNTIVFAAILALVTPFGIIGLPDFFVKRYQQAKMHLALLGAAIAVIAILSGTSVFFIMSGQKEIGNAMPGVASSVGGVIIFGSLLWSMWEGAWMLGHIETVRAQANQKH